MEIRADHQKGLSYTDGDVLCTADEINAAGNLLPPA